MSLPRPLALGVKRSNGHDNAQPLDARGWRGRAELVPAPRISAAVMPHQESARAECGIGVSARPVLIGLT